MLTAVLNCLLAYLLGSISGSLVLGRVRGVDIRKSGSGNAGGTNAFRTQGFWFALGVVAIDIGKGVVAAAYISHIAWPGLDIQPANADMMAWCGLAAVVGHCYPLWHGFRGGKGAATAIGAIAVIQPLALVPLALTWVLTLTFTGWVGLATMLAGFSLIPSFLWLDADSQQLAFAIILAFFLVFTHRANIGRMLRGEEYRFEKAMWRSWFG